MVFDKSPFLTCPIDSLPLQQKVSSYVCDNGHSFDIAKQGYINLLPVQHKRSRAPGDNHEMVMARRRFLDSAGYEPIAAHLLRLLMGDSLSLAVLDAGCGEGYYLSYLRQGLVKHNPHCELSLCGIDISKQAIIAAAKRDRAITWVVGSNKQLPVQRQSMDVIVCMFGFPNFEVFKSALKPQGRVILIDPTPDHLLELRESLYSEVRKGCLSGHDQALGVGFREVDQSQLQYQVELTSAQQIVDLAMMTPHYYRAKQEARDKLALMQRLMVTVSVGIKVFSL